MGLFKIQGPAQEVSDAIAAVLGVDVTIVDNNMTRVAATGRYRNEIGKRLPDNCSFETVLKTKQYVFIEETDSSTTCILCSDKVNCREIAAVGYPIINEGRFLGVIGLIAFEFEQQSRIHNNRDSLLVFLDKLSWLMVQNLKYIDNITKLTLQDKVTNMLIDEIDNGVLFTDNEGNIKIANAKAAQYLERRKEGLVDKNIDEIIPGIKLDIKYDYHIEKKVEISGEKKSLMIKSRFIPMEDGKVSNIIEINKTANVIRDAYMLMEGNSSIMFDDIIGNSPNMIAVKELARSVAKSQSTVIIRGESGTGKELFARAIHNSSDRNYAPFIAINCASIPDNLLEAELFGYEGGAFTGAKKEGQIGKFELANQGTLFLDEIGDMPMHLQPKILRALQEKSYRRVGGTEIINLDFRLITATNRNLEEMIETNKFREDLYYRLNVIPIYLPPLRERKEDIDLLCGHLLHRYCSKLDIEMKKFSSQAKLAINNYDWPGNIRELENAMEYLVNITSEVLIGYEDLPYAVRHFFSRNVSKKKIDSTRSLKTLVEDFEKGVLENLLNNYGATTKDKIKISKMLKINLSTLYRKLAKYNLQD